MGARYFYVDIILRRTSIHRNPANLWDNIENMMHLLTGKKSPPEGSPELEAEMKQLTVETLKKIQQILIKFIDLVGRSKFSDFDNVDTRMPYIIDFDLSLEK